MVDLIIIVGVTPLILNSSRDKGKTIGSRVKPRIHRKADYFAVILIFMAFFMSPVTIAMDVLDYQTLYRDLVHDG